MIPVFKQKNPVNLLLLLITGVLLKMPMFMKPHGAVTAPADGPLYTAILKFFDSTAVSLPFFYPVLTFALLFVQAAVLNRFINMQRMMNRATFLPGMAYMLITSLLPDWNYFSSPLLVNTILLIIVSVSFGIYNKQNASGAVFNIGLVTGIAGFIFIPSFVFIIWIFLSLLVLRPFRINEWLICILGVTTPFYFYAIYIFLSGSGEWHKLLPSFYPGVPSMQQSLWLAGSVFLLMIPFLAGGYYVQDSLRRMLINVRKGWSLLLLYLLVTMLFPYINSSNSFENWVPAMIPLAAFHACAYLYATWKPLPHILFWIIVGFILVYQYSAPGPGW